MNIEEVLKILNEASKLKVDSLSFGGLNVRFSPQIFTQTSVPYVHSSIDTSPNSEWQKRADLAAAHYQENFTKKDPAQFAAREWKIEDILKPPMGLDPAQLTDEEVLYAATPYFDELQAKKADHQQKIDDDLKK
jgi:hypothetical protein